MKNNLKTTMDFNLRLHRIGRLWMFFGILLVLLVPVIMCIYYKQTPDWTVFLSPAIIAPLIVNIGGSIFEPFIYAPMVGTNGEYLAFLTGNLSNLKIPCVVKAQEIAGTKAGTEENELVSTIAIATSSLVTAGTIGIFVLCLALIPNLQTTIEENKFLIPAFGCVVFALFGSLGGKYIAKNPKLALIPALGIVIICTIIGVLGSNLGSSNMFIGIALCVVFGIFQYFRDKKKLREKEEKHRLAAIAAGMSYEQLVAIEKQQAADEAAEKLAEKEAQKAAKQRKKH